MLSKKIVEEEFSKRLNVKGNYFNSYKESLLPGIDDSLFFDGSR